MKSLSDRELLERFARQLDHLDLMLHEVHQFITEHKPALDKALMFLDNPVKTYLSRRKSPYG